MQLRIFTRWVVEVLLEHSSIRWGSSTKLVVSNACDQIVMLLQHEFHKFMRSGSGRVQNFSHDFLWNDAVERRKYHMVRWGIICNPIARRVGWWERMDGIFLDHNYKSLGLWKAILSVRTVFMPWIRYRAHDGMGINFWHDEWCVHTTLKRQFHMPFRFLIGVLRPL